MNSYCHLRKIIPFPISNLHLNLFYVSALVQLKVQYDDVSIHLFIEVHYV